VFILIVIAIPCTVLLLYLNRSKGKRNKSFQQYENLMNPLSSSSSSSEDDEEKKSAKQSRTSNAERDDDADNIIAEIANRREAGFYVMNMNIM